jgi:hypothetical protein
VWDVLVVLFRMNYLEDVDALRFIGGVHTTSRQLYICSEIVSKIGSKQTPLIILKVLMKKWSINENLNNEFYSMSKGKLTDGGKETTALVHYLSLCKELNLLSQFNDVYSRTRSSYLLSYFSDNRKCLSQISFSEKLFYLFQLIHLDADGVIYIIDEISNGFKSQSNLQKGFEANFSRRLLNKSGFANSNAKSVILEKYKTITFQWKSTQKYSEHLLAPRCAWLCSLDIIKQIEIGNGQAYCLTQRGEYFRDKIPVILNSDSRDVNELWIYNCLFEAYASYNPDVGNLKPKLNNVNKEFEFGEALEKAIMVVKTSDYSKIPLLDTFIFVSIYLIAERNLIFNFKDLQEILKIGFVYNSVNYYLKYSGRINESYIVVNRIL